MLTSPQLLLPEIRITVSNLSQAIRFIVDNDFFTGVELKPGQAEDKMIEMVTGSLDNNGGRNEKDLHVDVRL